MSQTDATAESVITGAVIRSSTTYVRYAYAARLGYINNSLCAVKQAKGATKHPSFRIQPSSLKDSLLQACSMRKQVNSAALHCMQHKWLGQVSSEIVTLMLAGLSMVSLFSAPRDKGPAGDAARACP